MRVVTDLAELQRGKPAVLTIGAFDGVHRGHQWLMRQVIDRARRLEYDSIVLTFDPSPQVVLRPGSVQLTGEREKARVIAALGPTVLAVLPFSAETAGITAGQFLATVLDHVNLAEVWVGADFAFGHNREGNVDFLIRSGQHSCFAVHVVPRQALDGTPISSTRVRELVQGGDVAGAAVLLGHYPSLRGQVVTGFGRGAGLGFPTANIRPPTWQLLPATGIYAAYVRLDDTCIPAAVSVGYNLQFGGKEITVEAYLLDFDGDLRDREVSLDFVERLREERKFDHVDALVEQMQLDVDRARRILGAAQEPGELIL